MKIQFMVYCTYINMNHTTIYLILYSHFSKLIFTELIFRKFVLYKWLAKNRANRLCTKARNSRLYLSRWYYWYSSYLYYWFWSTANGVHYLEWDRYNIWPFDTADLPSYLYAYGNSKYIQNHVTLKMETNFFLCKLLLQFLTHLYPYI